ncbi:MAG: hypothetical protein JXR10_10720 [Cyclobacteriaceae bacterium]
MTIIELLTIYAEKLLHGHRSNIHGAYVEITNGCPRLLGKSISAVFNSEFSMLDAFTTVSRIHGYQDWSEVESNGNQSLNSIFETALDLMLSGDLNELRKLINQKPELTQMQSDFGHSATLLHYCAANGVETYRQMVPINLPEIARTLIDSGADKNALMHVYDGNFTPRQLVSSSAHPHNAGILDTLVKTLS